MTFDWSEYLTLARELMESAPTAPSAEARLRASASRAYYAAFCSARNRLRYVDGDKDIPTRGAHDYVRRKYQNSLEPARQQIGSWLDGLWRARVNADYRDDFPGIEPATVVALDRSERVLRNLSTLAT